MTSTRYIHCHTELVVPQWCFLIPPASLVSLQGHLGFTYRMFPGAPSSVSAPWLEGSWKLINLEFAIVTLANIGKSPFSIGNTSSTYVDVPACHVSKTLGRFRWGKNGCLHLTSGTCFLFYKPMICQKGSQTICPDWPHWRGELSFYGSNLSKNESFGSYYGVHGVSN